MPLDDPDGPTRAGAGHAGQDAFAAYAAAAIDALSGNTQRAVRSDLAIYAAWCSERGVSALPAGAETITAFVDAMAAVRAPATVRRYVASIAAAHRAMGYAKATGSEPVRRALQRMHRRKGRRQAQARGLTWALRQRLMEAAGEGLIDTRNRALLAVGYDTLLRRGELVALQVTDIVEELGGAGTVLVRRSKADPEGRGATVYLARDSMALVREWLKKSAVCEGKLFRSLNRGVVGERLDASQVPRIFKAMAGRAGLPAEVVEGISGHSTRVGAAQDMVAGGIGMAAILHAGRWKTPAMVNRYGERLLARRSGAAQLARLQHRE
ncbi:MAG: tyrosine-type recombinase/integrase [Defluviicoccus sp.]|nr:tyrosine-type recombinase/integrase [Defluviicoccus sp.]MDE0278415.1 tyrosine-type recombinase/integrase [Defluviicoccus sp.]